MYILSVKSVRKSREHSA